MSDNGTLGGRRILVVEDDYIIAQDIVAELEKVGASVAGPAPSVGKALRLLEKGPAVDAAVLDVTLGDEKSFPIAEVLEAQGVPFLFATGYNSGDIPGPWRRFKIVTKPLRISSIHELLAGSISIEHPD